jgi:hypothetical protein
MCLFADGMRWWVKYAGTVKWKRVRVSDTGGPQRFRARVIRPLAFDMKKRTI